MFDRSANGKKGRKGGREGTGKVLMDFRQSVGEKMPNLSFSGFFVLTFPNSPSSAAA